jgi:zinc protease
MKQIKFQLKNKLRVILVPSHKSPVVSVQMWVKTGSADEPKGFEGISHFIEHLVFKGTRAYGVGEIAATVEASGGELNAYTSFDQTVFYVTISKTYAEVALDVVSEMMGYPLFDGSEVDSEREVVCEEIKMGEDSPQRSATQLLFRTVFKKHPYGTPVIGYAKNVRSWPVKKIKEYYQSRYVPKNMSLIVSGDFDPKEMRTKIAKYFSDFSTGALKPLARKREPSQKSPRIAAQTKKISETTFQLAFRSPQVKHKDVAALDVLAMLLGQGETSRLHRQLRLERHLVNSVSAFNYSPQDDGLFAISLRYIKPNIDELFAAFFGEIELARKIPPTWEELRRAIVNISSEQFYSIETVDDIAQKIGSALFYLNDTNAHEKYLKQIQSLTPKEILRVAKKYLDPRRANICILGPDTTKKNLAVGKGALQQWRLVAKSSLARLNVEKAISIPKIRFKKIAVGAKEEVSTIVSPGGTEIIFYPSSEIPTVSAKILFGGGARLEAPSEMGLTEMLTRLLVTRTQRLKEDELLKKIEDCAAGISAFGGKNTVGFSVDYMKVFEGEVLGLVEQVVGEPIFDETIFKRELTALKNLITTREDNPSFLCGRQFNQAIYPDHPISYEQTGTQETLANIDVKKVQGLFDMLKAKENMQVVVVGDADISKWQEIVGRLERAFVNKGRQLKKFEFAALKSERRVFLEKEKEQSHVIIGWQGISLGDPRRYALQIIQAVLAGQGGRLFYELRDKNSLAYSVAPIKMETLEAGYFGGYIACSPDKVEKAIRMFKEEFAKLCEKEITTEELQRAQKYLIGQHDIGLQRKSAICNLIAFDHFYGNDFRESLDVAPKYLGVTAAQVRSLASQLFTRPCAISIVGKALAT